MNRIQMAAVTAVVFGMGFGAPDTVYAHCDGMDGPVVTAAQKALDTEDVNLILIWVQKDDEAEVRAAFQKTLAVRQLSAEARELADRYFFETVVRLHRAGEGAPYTGLKPAGRDLGPAIAAADKAVEEGSADDVQHLLRHAVTDGIADRFTNLTARQDFDSADVEAGREYVRAYVAFIHYVETLHRAAHNPAHGHFPEPPGGQTDSDHASNESE